MNKFQMMLTRYVYLRPLKPKSQRAERIKLSNDEEVDVILYSPTRYTVMAGQCTLFGTIIVNELAVSSPGSLQRVVTHELAHKRQWYSYLAYPIFILFVPVAFMMLFSAAGVAIYSVISLNLESAKVAGIFTLEALPILVVPCAYSWFIEYKAEAFTFKRLGLNKVIEIDKNRPRRAPTPLFWRIAAFLTHPPPRLIHRLYRHFNKIRNGESPQNGDQNQEQ